VIEGSAITGRSTLSKLKINIFNVIAAICSLLLVVYAWLMFLPMFEGLSQYSDVKNIIIVLSIALIAVSGFQLYVAIWGREEKSEDQSSEPEKE
jgi:membrane protein DedA with SNARE-associated domain